MTITADELTQAGIALSPAAFDALVRQIVREVGRTHRAVLAPPALPATEAAALAQAGLVDGPPPGGTDPVALTAARFAALLASSLTVPEAAARLRLSPARIRQSLAERTLYGFKYGHEWRLPAFQFAGDARVPGIERVFPQLDPAEHPVEVENWFTLPSAELTVDGELVSPRDWLLSGRPPEVVAEAAGLLDP